MGTLQASEFLFAQFRNLSSCLTRRRSNVDQQPPVSRSPRTMSGTASTLDADPLDRMPSSILNIRGRSINSEPMDHAPGVNWPGPLKIASVGGTCGPLSESMSSSTCHDERPVGHHRCTANKITRGSQRSISFLKIILAFCI